MGYVYFRRKTYNGFRQWTAAYLSIALGMILLSQRNIRPDFITIVIGNACLVGFIMLLAHGLTAFASMKQRNWLYAAAIFIYIFGSVIYTYIRPDLNMRIIFFSCFVVPFGIGAAVVVYRDIPRIMPQRNWFLISNFMVNSAWFIMRFILMILYPIKTTDLITAGPVQSATIIISMEISIISMAGLIILTAQRVEHEMSLARDEIKTLKGFLPICASCKKIRDDEGYWNQVEEYISRHTDVEFSHGICPECMKNYYTEFSSNDKG